MSCRSCGSKKQTTFNSDLNIHFPGLENLTKPPVSAFAKLVVCLDCGLTEFHIREIELHRLCEGTDSQSTQ